MKNTKRLLTLFLAFSMLISIGIPAFAANEIKVKLDGTKISFDVSPQIINSRTMVPLRAIFEALGASVEWDSSTQTVTSTKGDTTISLTINNPIMKVNGADVTLDSPGCLIDNRTLVPVRAISEAFGTRVEWNGYENTVNILTDNPEKHIYNHNKYSSDPVRQFEIQNTKIIRGSQANSLIESENSYNAKPSSNQEWVLMEFSIKYISSTNGENDKIKASDLIFTSYFFNESKSSLPNYSIASFMKTYKGHGIFDIDMYPGSTSKIAIGILTEKNAGNIYLQIPNKKADALNWMLCDGTGKEIVSTTSSKIQVATGTVTHNKYSSDPIRQFDIKCTNMISGSQANAVISSENSYNAKPSSSQEWILMEFDVKYLSSSKGSADEVKASDIIFTSYFYNESKSNLPNYSIASFMKTYKGHGIFDIKMYPGSSAKIVIGILTDKNVGNVYLQVPNKKEDTVSWIDCGNTSSGGMNSGSSSQGSSSTPATSEKGAKELCNYILKNGIEKGINYYITRVDETDNFTYISEIRYNPTNEKLEFLITVTGDSVMINMGFTFDPETKTISKNSISGTVMAGSYISVKTEADAKKITADTDFSFTAEALFNAEVDKSVLDAANTVTKTGFTLWGKLVESTGNTMKAIGFSSL